MNTTGVPLTVLCLKVPVEKTKLELCQLNLNCHVRPCEVSTCPAKEDVRGKRRLWRKGGVCSLIRGGFGTVVAAGVYASIL